MNDEDTYDADMQNLIDQVTQSCLTKLRDERSKADQLQNNELNILLQEWSGRVVDRATESVSKRLAKDLEEKGIGSSASADSAAHAIESIQKDLKDRHGGLISTMQAAHSRQLEVLRAAIAEERKQFAQSQLIFEQTLKTRYECMVDALNEKVKAEQEARMQRALENLERAARLESERAKQSFEVQQEAELTLSKKFKSIVSDLRRSWEEEETGRAMQLEERLRSHYSVVLEHMEAQLKMALKLQDDADKQWLEDVEARNRQQIETLRAFEDKCRRLYDIRLTEYAEKTSQQIAQYEEQLLEAGTVLASEKAQFESRLRRIKLACSRWKIAYQKDVHERYQQMTAALEERYMGEVAERLQEINDLQSQLSESQIAIQQKEQDIIKVHKMYAPGGGREDSHIPTTSSMRSELQARWNELKTPPADRVDSLVNLLDTAQVTPQMVTKYEAIMDRLTARQPIAQLINRKQFIEYKLKLASRMGSDVSSGGMSAADRAALITELTEVQSSADNLIHQYEKKYGESYNKTNTAASIIASAANYSPAHPHTPIHAIPSIQHDSSVHAQQSSVDKSGVPPLPPVTGGESSSVAAQPHNNVNTGNANDSAAKSSSSTSKAPSSAGRKLERRSSWTAGSPDRQRADSGNNNEEKYDSNDGTGRRPSVAGGVAAMMAKFGQN